MACRYQMVHTIPWPSHHSHLSTCPTIWHHDLDTEARKLVSNACSQAVTAYFTLASVANHLSSRCFSRCPNTRESLSSVLRTGYDARDGRLRKNLTTVKISLNSLRRTWLASGLQQTPKWSKLSSTTPGRTSIFYAAIQALVPWWGVL